MRPVFLQVGNGPKVQVAHIDNTLQATSNSKLRLKAAVGAPVERSAGSQMFKLTEPILGYDQEFTGTTEVAEDMNSPVGDYKLIEIAVKTVFPGPPAN